MSEVSIDPSPPAIDWSTITTTVECPLCLYNLRGLIESRCPECGYKFEWPELLEPGRARHRYLFEHHPQRNWWSFFRTLRGGIRHRKFWTDLKPTQVVRVRRLIIYWLLCTFLMLLLPLFDAMRIGVGMAQLNREARLYAPLRAQGIITPQARQRYLDANFPLPPSRVFLDQFGQSMKSYVPVMAIGFGTLAIWPWLTFAALMVFAASMRKAKVQRSHVLRCVIYSADAAISWMLLSMIVLTVILVFRQQRAWRDIDTAAFWLLVLLWLIRLDRLKTAYRKYLQFDHPFPTALASQIMVLLAFGGILFWGQRLLLWMR